MFLNFNNTFKNKEKTNNRIPPIVLEQMSKSLPGELFYKSDDGYAFVSGFNKVEDLIFDIPDEIKAEIGDENINISDILLYSYNSQETIKLRPAKEGFVKVDGEYIPVDVFVRSLNTSNRIEKGSFYVTPPLLSEHNSFILSNDEFEEEMSVERVPNKSIRYGKYEAHCRGIYLTFLIPFTCSGNAIINMSYSTEELDNYQDLIKCISLFNSLLKGEGKINNTILKPNITSSCKTYDDLIIFLKKVDSIESMLGCKFDLYTGDISYGLARDIEGLYINLIEKKPVKNYEKIESITFESDPDTDIPTEKKYYLIYSTIINKTILGVELQLPTIICIYNIDYKLKNNSNNSNNSKAKYKAEIIYNDESYSSLMSFKDDHELNKYTENYKNVAEKMMQCKDVNSIIK